MSITHALATALFAGLSFAVASKAIADPPPAPAPTTRQQCWDQYVGTLQRLYDEMMNSDPRPSIEDLRTILDAAIEDLRVCLEGLAPPDPAPTRTDCFTELVRAMRTCVSRFPDLHGPFYPNTITPMKLPHPARKPCFQAAREAYRKCRELVAGTLASLTVPDARLAISPDMKHVLLTLRYDGSEPWVPTFSFCGVDPNIATSTCPQVTWADAVGPGYDTEFEVAVPAGVFAGGPDEITVVVSAKDRLGNFLDGGLVVLKIQWRDADVNRDALVNNDDILAAFVRLGDGRFTLEQYNLVVQAVQGSNPYRIPNRRRFDCQTAKCCGPRRAGLLDRVR